MSGTHASGKSTLVGDFAARHPEYRVLPDPYEELLDDGFDELDARLFGAQLEIAARRLLSLPTDVHMIAERGPLDFLAYLTALDRPGRPRRSPGILRAGTMRTQAAAAHIDLLVLVPLDASVHIYVGDDEDLELRNGMNAVLLELADDPDLAGGRVVELLGDRAARCAQLEHALHVTG